MELGGGRVGGGRGAVNREKRLCILKRNQLKESLKCYLFLSDLYFSLVGYHKRENFNDFENCYGKK